MIRSLSAAAVAVALAAASAAAEAPREIAWDDLVPAASPLLDPLAHLTVDQRIDLEIIAWARALNNRGRITKVSPEFEDAVGRTHRLTKQGLDAEALLSAYREFEAEIARRNEAVVDELEGRLVRMPGFALPLEFSPAGVRELLLVPYVGACIHVPPPPPNQIVFVRLDEAFMPNDLYTPVWITGRMSVKRMTKALSLVDGTADVDSGYELNGLKIEPYGKR
jgi:hypothetical protein